MLTWSVDERRREDLNPRIEDSVDWRSRLKTPTMASEAVTWVVVVEEEERRAKRRVKVGQLGGGGIYKRRVGSEGGVGCGGEKPRRKGRGSGKIDEWPSTGGSAAKKPGRRRDQHPI